MKIARHPLALSRPTARGVVRSQPSAAPDSRAASVEGPKIYSPADFRRDPVKAVVERMLVGRVEPELVQEMSRGLAPFGAPLLERLADNGLTIVVPEQGYAHYSRDNKRITFPKGDLQRDQAVPFRDYMLLHEMAHALDFLLEPEQGPLSERGDLGIDRHRGRLNDLYQPVLGRFQEIEQGRRRQGTWGPRPGFPVARVYGEDFMTVVETVTGEQLSERPARGHLTILEPSTRPTEYFADAVYVYLHNEEVRSYDYTLPDGQPIAHEYPPNREHLKQRDPKMFAALDRFFSQGGQARAGDLTVSDRP